VHLVFIPEAQAGIFGASGAVVWRVESGTGQAAGLHAGDVVAAVNDQKIESEDDLRRVLRGIGPGKSRYLIRRGEQTLTLEIDCPTCTTP
jgi:S1-C subfamily serine protease